MSYWYQKMFPKPQPFTGAHANPNLDNNISSIYECEKHRLKICNDFKKLNERLYDINNSEKRLLDDLFNSTAISSINTESELNSIVEKWRNTVANNCTNRQDLITITNKTLLEPMNKFQIILNELKNAIKRYEQLISDGQKLTQKVQKYKSSERTASNLLKLNQYEKSLEEVQKDCSHLSQLLQRELPMFMQRKVEYFQPSLTAFISSQVYYCQKISSLIDENNLICVEHSQENRKDNQMNLFKSIDSLSIVNS